MVPFLVTIPLPVIPAHNHPQARTVTLQIVSPIPGIMATGVIALLLTSVVQVAKLAQPVVLALMEKSIMMTSAAAPRIPSNKDAVWPTVLPMHGKQAVGVHAQLLVVVVHKPKQ